MNNEKYQHRLTKDGLDVYIDQDDNLYLTVPSYAKMVGKQPLDINKRLKKNYKFIEVDLGGIKTKVRLIDSFHFCKWIIGDSPEKCREFLAMSFDRLI